ncbi:MULTISPECIES: tyrosine-protein phosphatase [unclassified Enterococcus]|uniref:tyrosine-protein phosphatase n=1 Tax=unclassified Enterococcus TaxID=2608891 RepID=UPI001A9AB091|nr:tyrosine-protein phosphatase [Enterococcus sp. DIV1271a]
MYTRLPLRGTYNTRDLGGYASRNGVTAWKRFLRSDSLTNLETEDVAILQEYNLTTIIDLRTTLEIEKEPTPEIKGVENWQISLIPENIGDVTQLDQPFTISMSEMYIQIIEGRKEQIKHVFETMAAANGCVLFHCAAGKDRTGVIAMLLLQLADVAKEDIIANYQTTNTYLLANPEVAEQIETVANEMWLSVPEYLVPVLTHLEEKYQNTHRYLTDIGLSQESISHLKSKLIDVTLPV